MAQLLGWFAGSHPSSTVSTRAPLALLLLLSRVLKPLHIPRVRLPANATLSLPFTSSVATGQPSWPLRASGSSSTTKGPYDVYRELKIKAWHWIYLKSRYRCFVNGYYNLLFFMVWLKCLLFWEDFQNPPCQNWTLPPHLLLKFGAFLEPLRFGLFLIVVNQFWLIHGRHVFCKLYNSVVYCTITWPCNHQHCSILEHFYHLKE